MTGSPSIARAIEDAAQERSRPFVVEDFSEGQLHKYLELHLGPDWPSIPDYVRSPLRRPLLAHLYRTISQHPGWHPETE